MVNLGLIYPHRGNLSVAWNKTKPREGGKKMKKLYASAMGIFLSMSLVVPVNAAPAGSSDNPKQQGIKNARKAMQGQLERDKKVHKARKKGQAQKKLAQSGR